MGFPTKVQDLYVTNGWYLDLPGLTSPHFETLEGLGKTSNSVEIVDAGRNKKQRFPTQIDDFPEMTFTRTEQGTPDDKKLAVLVESMRKLGVKVPAVAYKLHHQKIVFSVLFDGFRFTGFNHPTWDVNGEDKFLISYTATCDDWTRIP